MTNKKKISPFIQDRIKLLENTEKEVTRSYNEVATLDVSIKDRLEIFETEDDLKSCLEELGVDLRILEEESPVSDLNDKSKFA